MRGVLLPIISARHAPRGNRGGPAALGVRQLSSDPLLVTNSENMDTRYDIVVVGGGMAGVMAALAAKSESDRVLIIEPSNVLGGQGTVGGVAGFCGDSERVNGLFASLIERLSQHGFISDYDPTADRREYDLEWCAYFLQEIVLEKQIDVLLHSRVIEAEAQDGCVKRLTISTAGDVITCDCGYIVDATGQCRVATLSGFPVIHEGANKQLPMSLYFTLWDTGKPVTPFLPPGLAAWESEDEIPMTSLHVFPSGKVEVKMKVVGFDAADGFSRSQAEIHARRNMMRLIYFLQTKGYGGVTLDRHVLASVSRSIGIREEKRIVGEHMLTEKEVKSGAVFRDAVAVGTYHFDYHWPDKMERAGTGITTMVEPYHIPLSCMIPRGAKNLLVTGRSACGDQMALSSFRVMATVAQMGFAAGHAARLCVESECDFKSVDIAVLQSRITDGGQSLDLSDYGDYLRHSLVIHERIPLEPAKFDFCSLPRLLVLANNRTFVAWIADAEDHSGELAIWAAERFQSAWSEPRQVASPPGLVSAAFAATADENGETALYYQTENDEGALQNWRIASQDEGQTWGDPSRVENVRERSELSNESSCVRIQDVLVKASVRAGGSGDGLSRISLSASRDDGNSWLHPVDVEKNGVAYSDPCIQKTSRGIVLVYVRDKNGLAFWHGSIEHLTDPDLVKWRDRVLHSGVVSMEA